MTEIISKAIRLIAIYARVSSSTQEKQETIQAQLLAIKEFAEKNGYTIVQEYIDDGWSGDILARPGLDRLRGDVGKKIWDAVLIYDPDRLARRYSYQELVTDELQEAGVEVIFITTPAPKNGTEKILHGVKGLFAEYERAKITERFRLGKVRKVKEGHVLTSEAPYGYDYVPKGLAKHGYYKINEPEARVMRIIFSWIGNEGMTIRGVIRKLQELGIKPRRSKRGVWSTSTISTLLRNKTYIGQAHYGASYAVVPEKPFKHEKYKKIRKTSRKMKPESEWTAAAIPVPALIDKDLFMRAQQQMERNFSLSRRNRKNDYLLSCLMRHSCGATMAGEGPHGGRNLYYRCTDRVRQFPLPPQCNERGINARVADTMVWNKLAELMSSPELLSAQIERWVKKRQISKQGAGMETDALKAELGKLKIEEDRYARAYGEGVITIEQLKEYTQEIEEKITSLQKQISDAGVARRESGTLPLLSSDEEIRGFAKRAKNMLQNLSFETKRAIVVNTINQVVSREGRLHVLGFIPATTFQNDVAFSSKHRYRRPPECREVNSI